MSVIPRNFTLLFRISNHLNKVDPHLQVYNIRYISRTTSISARNSVPFSRPDNSKPFDSIPSLHDEKRFNLIELRKNFFNPQKNFIDKTTKDHIKYLRENSIDIKGKNITPPIQSFSDHSFPDVWLEKLYQFKSPTPIQAQGLSVVLSGRDMIGMGQTGSGKTLGYMLPALTNVAHHTNLLADSEGSDAPDSPLGLILSPTRELAFQILQVADEYGKELGVNCASFYGGVEKEKQLKKLMSQNAKLVIGTPGRLHDLLSSGELCLSQVGFVVLDEADRMLEMGFEDQLRAVLGQTRTDRQTVMWSATMSKEVRCLAEEFLSSPIHVTVGSEELEASPTIVQKVSVVEQHKKSDKLVEILRSNIKQNFNNKAVVFCNTVNKVQRLGEMLPKHGLTVATLHGDKDQAERERAVRNFREGQIHVLVATDVAARGLDIPDLSLVVNYDIPTSPEVYVHRIGRTGRRGLAGLAHALFTRRDADMAGRIIKILERSGQPVDNMLRFLAHSAKTHDYNPRHKRGSWKGHKHRYSKGGQYC